MKVKVTLYVAGKTFTEVVIVSNVQEAKATALARHPFARVIGLNPIFK